MYDDFDNHLDLYKKFASEYLAESFYPHIDTTFCSTARKEKMFEFFHNMCIGNTSKEQ